ncbi:16S rRNA (guanine(966)-N(2))-methyltransferase RsmD [Elioraea rosea]|uniref:16S rRNA (guanine(966)-N(2))-methyltransferase RsmD n=1 Tax=Elioraea rosea TaxID=2492390 RepID=UPI001184296F|nr:16S rRNA (guanine(966)-N(2))-methyltransferase RsmD [Elioraea rosea]
MRIVAGAWRGRRLTAPAGNATRPTSDRARQALFDVLTHAPFAGRGAIQDAVVLDAFAGTGALGLEALSRGAAEAWFLENAPEVRRTIAANIAACRAGGRAHLIPGDALRPPPARAAAGLVFLDPPYGKGLVAPALAALVAAGWIAPEARVVAEIGADEASPDLPGFMLHDIRRWGAAQVLFVSAG